VGEPARLNLRPYNRRQLLECDPSSQTIAGLRHMDGVHEQVGILRERRGNIQEGNASRGGVAPEDSVLKIGHLPNVRISQGPKLGIQLSVNVLVPRGLKPHSILGEPLERAKHQLAADGSYAVPDCVEVIHNPREIQREIGTIHVRVSLIHAAGPVDPVSRLAWFWKRAKARERAIGKICDRQLLA
jgi:hypothetical protein